MKHAVLINNAHIENFSVRHLGAYLTSRGFRVSVIHYESRKEAVFEPMPAQALEILGEFCQDCDLVGVTVLTTHLVPRCRQITRYLKDRITAPVIWGGPPVIADPVSFLAEADLVCAGEGETVMEQLLEERPVDQIPGLGFVASDGSLVVNDLPPMLDVNDLPLPRVDLENGYVLTQSGLVSMTDTVPATLSTYSVLLVRGCPYGCAYCLNSRLKQVFESKGPYVRKIDVDRVIAELVWAKTHIPHLRRIIIDDDDFFLNSEDRMTRFLAQYMDQIRLPVFYIQANTRQITEKKLDILVNSGLDLRYLKIGLQSGSPRISREIFLRPLDRQAYLGKLEMVMKRGIRVMIDVISDNPYDTLADKHAVLRFYLEMLKRIPDHPIERPVKIYDHKLMYYPGTPLYEKVLEDGHISADYVDQVLLKRSTLRLHKEDQDHDALMVSLFNTAANRKPFHRPAHLLLRILAVPQVFRVAVRYRLAKLLNRLSRIPAVAGLLEKNNI
ncbi:MAG: cobalamin-dependent protein [Desulfotignum sp.]|nr:cobalamin-dependent protein [Desulfotignum sp.]